MEQTFLAREETESGEKGSGADGQSEPDGRSARKRRIGRFIVGHDTFRVDWRALLPLFSKVAPVRAESLFHLDGIEYLALCEDFEEIGMEETVPFYDVTYRQAEDGRDMFIFSRRETSNIQHPTPNIQ